MDKKILYSKRCTPEERERILEQMDRTDPLGMPGDRKTGKLSELSGAERENVIAECIRLAEKIGNTEGISTEVVLFPEYLTVTCSTQGGLDLTALQPLLEMSDRSFAFRSPATQELNMKCVLYCPDPESRNTGGTESFLKNGPANI